MGEPTTLGRIISAPLNAALETYSLNYDSSVLRKGELPDDLLSTKPWGAHLFTSARV